MIKHSSNLFEIQIPCEDFFVSCFIILDEEKVIIVDSGSSSEDVDKYIKQGIENLKLTPTDLIISHQHFDHAGGKKRLLEIYSNINLHEFDNSFLSHQYKDISHNVTLAFYPGHTKNCLAVILKTENILLSLDCLEFFGVGRYGLDLEDISSYFNTLKQIEKEEFSKIIASHCFVPCGQVFNGSEEIDKAISTCYSLTMELISFVKNHLNDSNRKIVTIFNKIKNLPPIDEQIVINIKQNM